ncbi:MAG: hypothetical protein V1493_04395, partial [Candidatus Diapherotrites archaeon]
FGYVPIASRQELGVLGRSGDKPTLESIDALFLGQNLSSFSPVFLLFNTSKNIETLADPGIYPLAVFFFTALSLFCLRKTPLLALPILWILAFFAFFGMWWITGFSNPGFYQLILAAPFCILGGVGANFLLEKAEGFSGCKKFSKKHGAWIIGASFFLLFALLTLFSTSLPAGHFSRVEPHWKSKAWSLQGLFNGSETECIYIYAPSQADREYYARAFSYFFAREKFVDSAEACGGKSALLLSIGQPMETLSVSYFFEECRRIEQYKLYFVESVLFDCK